MELMGNLKDKVSKAQNKEEARGLIEKAGMKLTDDELDMVAGGQMLPEFLQGEKDRNFK